jgi:Trk K+ transport system NAD-binding subunit
MVGMIRRQDIIRAYNHAIVKRAHHQHHAETLRLGKLDGAGFTQIDIPPDAPTVGRRISEIALPDDCLIVSVRRGRKLYIAHGNTLLQREDLVTVFAADDCLPEVRKRLTGEVPPEQHPETNHHRNKRR